MGNYFVNYKTDSNTKYVEELSYYRYAEVPLRQHICCGLWDSVPTNYWSSNCAPLLVDLFLYSYEAEFGQKLLSNKQKALAASFNFTFRYIYIEYMSFPSIIVHFIITYIPPKLEIKETTGTYTSRPYLDLLLCETDGTL